ncbi:hypothetical protein L3V77_10590 [Vibrio sp. DW001]|uniref:hypothetical protein n=1 Tax=Vibrio sp. DW001 TaxID=2912315 RepID=UPI0023B10C9E|nr:hypothetical protein [Vibrio sp. DW001]WED25514.1 hypothetical protein L3V77_10590 [Vibrio sp. DW001]
MLSEDGHKAIAKDIETTHEAGQDIHRAADSYVSSDDMDLFDFGKSVSDNRKLTELKNDLLSSQEGLDLLKDLKSTEADKVLAAQAEISKKAQEKYGLTPEQVNFYDADKTTSVAMQDNDVRDVHGGVVRKYDAIDGRQEYEKDKAKLGQIGNNVKDGATNTAEGIVNIVDAALSPMDTVNGWIDSLTGTTPESIAKTSSRFAVKIEASNRIRYASKKC